MDKEKQRIKIAEACGLFRLAPLKRTNRNGKDNPLGVRLWCCIEDYGGAKEYADLPDYLNDLNAMHEAESVCIGTIHAKKHGQMLQEVTGWHCVGIVPDHARDLTHLSKLSRATAAQRAEAFLKTLNLWE